MRGRYLVIGLVVVLAAVTGVLIYQGNQTQTTGSASVVVTQTVTGAGCHDVGSLRAGQHRRGRDHRGGNW